MNKIEFLNILDKFDLSDNKKNTLLSYITGLSREALFIKWNDLTLDSFKCESIISDLEKWRPFEYIVWSSEFMWLDFYVDERVLIPRDDTSVIVENIIKWNYDLLIDVWTWSWTIPISFLKNIDIKTDVVWLDLSEMAIEVSKINMNKHQLSYIIEKSDLLTYIFDNIDNFSKFKKICISANLPYIKKDDFNNMDSSVYNFEPDLALYWWEITWFEIYENLINQAIKLNRIIDSEITLFIEIWFDQKAISEIFLTKKWLKFEYFKDSSRINRVLKILF